MNYLRATRLYPLRALYWLFVRPFLWHSRTIEDQYQQGWIKLPNELGS